MKNPRRPLLIGGICLLAAAAALHLAGLTGLSPWALLAGVLLTALYFVLGRVAAAPESREADSMLNEEGQTTMLGEPPKQRDD